MEKISGRVLGKGKTVLFFFSITYSCDVRNEPLTFRLRVYIAFVFRHSSYGYVVTFLDKWKEERHGGGMDLI